MKLTRREFGRQVIYSAAALSASLSFPTFLIPSASKSRVVIARSEKLKRVNHQLSEANAAHFLNQALVKITGHSSSAAAWRSLFSPGESIGIKLSCLPGKPLSSGHGLVMAIVQGLRAVGVKENNIYIWERTNRELKRAGFAISRSGLKIEGTDGYLGDGYSDNIEFAGSVGTRFSRIMEKVDALINVPVLKDHDLSGVSISMKNFYGAIYNPNKFHRNNCDPYIAELSTHPLIKDKLRLIVCDASRIQVNNGPAFYPKYAWEYGGLLVSRDPVALDYIGWQIIEKRRKQIGLKPLKAVNREPKYILTAARLKLGNIDEKYIQKIEI
ncbi:MAG: DUF362 domain-containing protein [Candidatus Aminicenantes bacterium]|jgi:uncharacterized protein (DUF362 family)